MINAGIVGATGYAGAMLVKLLNFHKGVHIKELSSITHKGKSFSTVYPAFKGAVDNILTEFDAEKMSDEVDVIFSCLPSSLAQDLVTPSLLEKVKVIDLSADFRLKDIENYEKYYKTEHRNRVLNEIAVYGLSELNREKIKRSSLIANPGCYTTCSILTLYPLIKENLVDGENIIIDAKSGVSGAGRSEKTANLFCECNESVKPYGIIEHRHVPEIEEGLGLFTSRNVRIQFTPHLVPLSEGLLVSSYVKAKDGVCLKMIKEAVSECYKNEHFIRIFETPVETRHVKGSNFVALSYFFDDRTNNVLAFGALDNLIKGAAGQAVQNMNIAFGLDEETGLDGFHLF